MSSSPSERSVDYLDDETLTLAAAAWSIMDLNQTSRPEDADKDPERSVPPPPSPDLNTATVGEDDLLSLSPAFITTEAAALYWPPRYPDTLEALLAMPVGDRNRLYQLPLNFVWGDEDRSDREGGDDATSSHVSKRHNGRTRLSLTLCCGAGFCNNNDDIDAPLVSRTAYSIRRHAQHGHSTLLAGGEPPDSLDTMPAALRTSVETLPIAGQRRRRERAFSGKMRVQRRPRRPSRTALRCDRRKFVFARSGTFFHAVVFQ